MEYEIGASDDGLYVILKICGVISRKTSLKRVEEAHQYGRKLGVNRFLVDLTEARNGDSVFEKYDFAYSDLKKSTLIDRYAVIAAVARPGDRSFEFGETVLRNSGLNVRFFEDRDAAVQYLRKKAAQSPAQSPGQQERGEQK